MPDMPTTPEPPQKPKSTPNYRLRRERERRAWSQQDLADEVGTTPLNVGRWERGITTPNPYFRQKLSEVFGKSPQELGFISAQGSDLTVTPSQTTSSTSSNGQATTVSLWNIPYRRNLFFTGRKPVLSYLHNTLNANTSLHTPIAVSQPQALSGLGGIGKTQTVIEYAYRYRNEYDAILWARAESSDLLVSDFLTIAALLTLPERNEPDQNTVVKAVLRWFDTHDRWLLILDNADDIEVSQEFIPSAGRGHVLLTTRAQATGTAAERIVLDTLSDNEGELFLLHRTKKLKGATTLESVPMTIRTQAQAIVEAVDGLPLALDQAAAYIEETSCSLSDYLKFYKTRRTRLLKTRGKDDVAHPEPVATTWLLSFEKIEHANPVATDLLRLCAFLHPDAIPEHMIMEGASELGSTLQPIVEDDFELNEAIGELLKYSLLKRDTESQTLSIHRLVQAVMKDAMKEDEERIWAERVVRMMSKVFPQPQLVENWPLCQLYVPHAQVVASLATQEKIISVETAKLFNNVGSFIYQRKGEYAIAEFYLRTSLEMIENGNGIDEAIIAEYMNMLAEVYHDQHKYEKAEQLYTKALDIWENLYGTVNANVAGYLNNLGLLAYDQDELEKALELHQRALSIRQQMFGLEHEETAQSMAHLAQVYQKQGKYDEAEGLLLQSLHIRERVLSPNHPSLAFILHIFGDLYYECGKYALAEQYLRKSLAVAERAYDTHHPSLANTLGLLAGILIDREEYEEAEPLCLRALEIQETHKTDGNGVINSLNYLGKLYYRQGKYALAEIPCKRALYMREQMYGPEHNLVAQSLTNLAQIYRAQEKYTEAQALLERALNIRIQTLGSEHFHVAHTLYALALLYSDQEKYEQAESFFQQTLTVRERSQGMLHPDVVMTLESYTNLLRKTGRESEAELLEARARAIRSQAAL